MYLFPHIAACHPGKFTAMAAFIREWKEYHTFEILMIVMHWVHLLFVLIIAFAVRNHIAALFGFTAPPKKPQNQSNNQAVYGQQMQGQSGAPPFQQPSYSQGGVYGGQPAGGGGGDYVSFSGNGQGMPGGYAGNMQNGYGAAAGQTSKYKLNFKF